MCGKESFQGCKEDLKIFLAEVDELLENIEEDLVELEKCPTHVGLIQEVFRVMHTIKGGAAMLGLEDAVEVTHLMESILDEVRSQGRKLDAQMVNVLFMVLDWLKDWRCAVAEDRERPSPEAVLTKVRQFEDKTGRSEAPTETSGKLGIEKKIGTLDIEDIYLLTVRFKSDAPLLSARCFQALTLIGEVSEIICSNPTFEDIENDKVTNILEVYLGSQDQAKEAKAVARSVQNVEEVTLRKYRDVQQKQELRNTATGGTTVKRSVLGKTVRVDVALLDFLMNMVGELVIDRSRLSQIATRFLRNSETSEIGNEVEVLASHLQRTCAELEEGIMRARLVPLKKIFAKFPRMIRDLAQQCGKQVDFEMVGEDAELDRTVIEAIDDPLIHILRNAVDHGVEPPAQRISRGKPAKGKIMLSAWHQENQVLVRVEDDGAGIDPEKVNEAAVRKGFMSEDAVKRLSDKEVLDLIFMPGFSTARTATEISGRGVGVDVVRSNLERVNGQLDVTSQVGVGTQVTLRLPLTLAIMRALLVKCGQLTYAIPTFSVEEVLALKTKEVKTVEGKPVINVRSRIFPLISLAGALRSSMWCKDPSERYALLTRTNGEPIALGVTDLVGEEEIGVKDMGRLLSGLKGIAGATILAQGDPAVIRDVTRLL